MWQKKAINHPWLGMVYTTSKNGDDWGWFMVLFYPHYNTTHGLCFLLVAMEMLDFRLLLFFLMGSASFRIEKAWCFQVTLNLKTWRWPCCGCSKAIDQPFLTVEFSGAKKPHLCCTVRRISSLRVTGNFPRKTAGKKTEMAAYNL